MRLPKCLFMLGLSTALVGCDVVFGLQDMRDIRPGLNGGGGEDCPQACEKDVWGRTFDGAGDRFVSKARFDEMGNQVVAGHFTGEIDLGGKFATSKGSRDIFVATLDASGKVTGGTSVGTEADEADVDIAFTPDGGVVFGGTLEGTADSLSACGTSIPVLGGGDTFICKLGADGTSQWVQRFTDQDPKRFGGVATSANGEIVATGAFAGSIQCRMTDPLINSNGGFDIVVWKLKANGECSWALPFGQASDQYGDVIAVDDKGNIFVAGRFNKSYDIGGKTHENTASNTDIFITKLANDGTVMWAKPVGNPNGINRVADIAISPNDSIYLVGEKDGNAFVMQFSQEGDILWDKTFGDALCQNATSVAVDTTGKVFIAGLFGGSIDFGLGTLTAIDERNMFAAAFSPAPEHTPLWSKIIRANVEGTPTIDVHDRCSILIGGGTTQQLNFENDCNPLTIRSGSNGFVAKIIPQLLP